MVSHDPAWFSGNKYSGSEDIMFLVCHVILQKQVESRAVRLGK